MEINNNISQQQFEEIERYLNSQMNPSKRLQFEHEMSSDSDLKQKVADIKTILFGVETSVLKQKLDDFHHEIPEKKIVAKKSIFLLKKLAIAASFIIAVGSFWFLNQNSNDKLYNQYFTPDPGLATTMSSTSNYAFYNAMVDYKQGDYKTAIKKWEAIETKNDTINYFLGVAHLANNNENKATKYLELVTKNNASTFNNEAYYYLGLAYLKNNNVKLAKKNLNFSTVDNSKLILSKLTD